MRLCCQIQVAGGHPSLHAGILNPPGGLFSGDPLSYAIFLVKGRRIRHSRWHIHSRCTSSWHTIYTHAQTHIITWRQSLVTAITWRHSLVHRYIAQKEALYVNWYVKRCVLMWLRMVHLCRMRYIACVFGKKTCTLGRLDLDKLISEFVCYFVRTL